MNIHLSQHHLWRDCYFPHWIVLELVKYQLATDIFGFIAGFSILCLCFMCLSYAITMIIILLWPYDLLYCHICSIMATWNGTYCNFEVGLYYIYIYICMYVCMYIHWAFNHFPGERSWCICLFTHHLILKLFVLKFWTFETFKFWKLLKLLSFETFKF